MIVVFCVLTSLLQAFSDTAEPLKLRLEMLDGATREEVFDRIQGSELFFESGKKHIAIDALSSITPLRKNDETSSVEEPQRFILINGSEFGGKIVKTSSRERVISIDLGLEKPIEIPLSALRAVRFGPVEDGAAENEFQSRLTSHVADKDLMIVSQDQKTVVLPGALEWLSPDGWEFTIGRKTQKQALDVAYGVVLGGMTLNDPKAAARSIVNLRSGGCIAGSIESGDKHSLGVRIGDTNLLNIPWERIASVGFRSGRVVYLSELAPISAISVSILDVEFPPRRNTSMTGTPLSIRGKNLARGIGTHARSRITYKLEASFERLLATIGIDDDAAPVGSAVFRIFGDGKVLYESPVLRREDPAKQINVQLEGAREITLECDDGGDSDVADHCDWGDVRIIGLPAIH